jgi:hypothetical protein
MQAKKTALAVVVPATEIKTLDLVIEQISEYLPK